MNTVNRKTVEDVLSALFTLHGEKDSLGQYINTVEGGTISLSSATDGVMRVLDFAHTTRIMTTPADNGVEYVEGVTDSELVVRSDAFQAVEKLITSSKKPVTVKQVAKKTGVSKQTVRSVLKSLENDGVIYSMPAETTKVGRPPLEYFNDQFGV